VWRKRTSIAAAAALAIAVFVGLSPGIALAGRASGAHPIYRVPMRRLEVALTLDDGPDPRYTPLVLAALRKYDAHATFFVLGAAGRAHPDLLRAQLAQGNEIGVHSFNRHVRFTTIRKGVAGHQIDLGKSAVIDITGRAPAFFRPPYGVWRQWVLTEASERGMRTIMWSVCFDHESAKTPKAVSDRVLSLVRPGEILLLHDGLGDRSKVVAALPTVLRELRRRGYKVVTVSRLLADSAAGR
jgi:peptidoglycan/xylan/chitin deacetylase (PgdA/CDA1 family)